MNESQLKKKILIVDDEGGIREIFYDHFSIRGYEVLCAGSVKEGFDLCVKEKPSAAILDYNLPDGLGEELLKRLKKIKPNIKIIMLTGNTLVPDLEERLLRGGADWFFEKGAPITEVSKKLQELISL